MTCIVGIIHKEKVYIGGDSAGVAGLDVTIRKDPKVFKVNDFVFGCTSSFRMIQLIRFSFNPPQRHPDTDIYKYMCTDFVDALRTCFKNGGFANINNSVERGGCFLVGYQGRLFRIDNDFQVGESVEKFDSVGCGEAYALGSLHGIVFEGVEDPQFHIFEALNTVAHFSGGVRPPFLIESI